MNARKQTEDHNSKRMNQVTYQRVEHQEINTTVFFNTLPGEEAHHDIAVTSCTTSTNFIISVCRRAYNWSITYPGIKSLNHN